MPLSNAANSDFSPQIKLISEIFSFWVFPYGLIGNFSYLCYLSVSLISEMNPETPITWVADVTLENVVHEGAEVSVPVQFPATIS